MKEGGNDDGEVADKERVSRQVIVEPASVEDSPCTSPPYQEGNVRQLINLVLQSRKNWQMAQFLFFFRTCSGQGPTPPSEESSEEVDDDVVVEVEEEELVVVANGAVQNEVEVDDLAAIAMAAGISDRGHEETTKMGQRDGQRPLSQLDITQVVVVVVDSSVDKKNGLM